MKRFKYSIWATLASFSLVGVTHAASTTIYFNNVEVPSIYNIEVVTTQWNGFGVGINNAYWYTDVRDPFDQMGLSLYQTGVSHVARINFLNGPVSNLTVQWLILAGQAGEYIDLYDSNNNLLSEFIGTSSNGTLWQTSNGNSYYGTVNFPMSNISYLTWHDNGGYVNISGISFETTAVPEPSIFGLLGAGLAGGFFLRRNQERERISSR